MLHRLSTWLTARGVALPARSLRSYAEFSECLKRVLGDSRCNGNDKSCPSGITVLKEFNTALSNGYRCPTLLVRNDTHETQWVEMSIDLVDEWARPVGRGVCFAVVAPGCVGLLHLGSCACEVEGTIDVHARYKLQLRSWPYRSLSGGLVVSVSDSDERKGCVVTIRNNSSQDAFVACVHLCEVCHNKDTHDPVGTRLREECQLVTHTLNRTLVAGEECVLQSEIERDARTWENGCEAFPVGWFFPAEGEART